MNKAYLLWIFALAVIMPIIAGHETCDEACAKSCNCGSHQNVAKVMWAHAVNSKSALDAVLKDGELYF